jgi:hypothetical protein
MENNSCFSSIECIDNYLGGLPGKSIIRGIGKRIFCSHSGANKAGADSYNFNIEAWSSARAASNVLVRALCYWE